MQHDPTKDKLRKQMAAANNSQLMALFVDSLRQYRESLTVPVRLALPLKPPKARRPVWREPRADAAEKPTSKTTRRNVLFQVWVLDTKNPWRKIKSVTATKVVTSARQTTIYYTDGRTIEAKKGLFGVSVFFTHQAAARRRLGLIMYEFHKYAKQYGTRKIPWVTTLSYLEKTVELADGWAAGSGTSKAAMPIWRPVLWLSEQGKIIILK